MSHRDDSATGDPVTSSFIAVRAYIEQATNPYKARIPRADPDPIEASRYVLIFDTETATVEGQGLRFGVYQLCEGDDLDEAGIFYDRDGLTEADLTVLRDYAAAHGLAFMTTQEFVETVLYAKGYELGAYIVGMNLPFDIARLALSHRPAKSKAMYGGFSLRLSANRPNVQIKHLSRNASIIQFEKPHKRASRGYFVDVKTLAFALTNESFSLERLAQFLKTPHQKDHTEGHGGPITPEYAAYAVKDVQVTWECFTELRNRYDKLGLKRP